MKKLLLLAAAAAAGLMPLAAEKTEAGWTFTQTLGGSVNPLGLEAGSRVVRVFPLFPGLEGPLWDSARVEAGLSNSLTPAYDGLQAELRIEPIAVFDVLFYAGPRFAYDLFGYGFTALGGYGDPYDASTRKDLDRKSGAGLRYGVTPTVKAAAGRFLFASSTNFVFFDMRAAASEAEDYFYDPQADLVLETTGGYASNETFVLFAAAPELFFGAAHYFAFVFDSEYVSQRLALAVLGKRKFDRALTGTLAVLAGTYLRDRYNSYRDGKAYAAVKAGCTVRLE